jgi:hypothetical protein
MVKLADEEEAAFREEHPVDRDPGVVVSTTRQQAFAPSGRPSKQAYLASKVR